MKAKIYIILLIISTIKMYSQVNIDAVSIFKMHLFLDSKNKMDTIMTKNDSLYRAFCDVVILKLDTLKVSGDYYLTKSVFRPKFKFFQLNEYSYTKKLDEKELQLFWIYGDRISAIAINQETGKSYRLLGFDNNDFLFFLADFREAYKEKNGNELRIKQFFKNYSVDKLNFECLYKGLKKSEIDRIKYPCLGRVSDIIWIE